MIDEAPEVAVLGSLNLDAVTRVPTAPEAGETVIARSVEFVRGGKGANQAVAAARLGTRVEMVGCVGADVASITVVADLEREGVGRAHLRTVAGVPTGTAFVMVDDTGENRVIVTGGANDELAAADVEAARTTIAGARVLLLQGETPLDVSALAAEVANGVVILNLAPATAPPGRLLAGIDILVVNEGELRTAFPAGDRDVRDAATRASGRLGIPVIVTLGSRGALLADGDEAVEIDAPHVDVADTTGAGDCFCGTLAAALASGSALVPALERAVTRASLSVTRPRTGDSRAAS